MEAKKISWRFFAGVVGGVLAVFVALYFLFTWVEDQQARAYCDEYERQTRQVTTYAGGSCWVSIGDENDQAYPLDWRGTGDR